MMSRLTVISDIRPGDIVLIYGKPRLVVYVGESLVVTGNGRGYRKYWNADQISGIVVRSFKLKPGKTFNGVAG